MIGVRSVYKNQEGVLEDVRTWGDTEAQARASALRWIVEHRAPDSIFKIGIEVSRAVIGPEETPSVH